MVADPRALKAVQYALAQLGDQYVWAAEGPDQFDCSGLMWAAYRSAGYQLARVARDQYYTTRSRSVDRYSLLPGDLVFFASGSSWTTIHHVGMYIGGGKMVHAPNSNEVVKVSTVWWSRFYAATRIFGAVPGPNTTPTATTPPTTPPPTTPPPTSTATTPPPSTTPAVHDPVRRPRPRRRPRARRRPRPRRTSDDPVARPRRPSHVHDARRSPRQRRRTSTNPSRPGRRRPP